MVVLAVHSHPDDIEFGIAGTLFLLKERGCDIHYMNIADGCCGTSELSREEIIRIRRDEAIAACRLLGAEYHESLCSDMEVFYEDRLLRRLAAVVREVNPDIIFTAPPDDYMEDHMNACRLALGAAFTKGMPNYATIPPVLPVSGDVAVYHAAPHGLLDGMRRPFSPDFHVDIGPVMPRKTDMLACHMSQKKWLDRTQGFDSYLQAMKDLGARSAAGIDGVDYAEGFRRHLHLGYSRTEYDPVPGLLGPAVHFPPDIRPTSSAVDSDIAR